MREETRNRFTNPKLTDRAAFAQVRKSSTPCPWFSSVHSVFPVAKCFFWDHVGSAQRFGKAGQEHNLVSALDFFHERTCGIAEIVAVKTNWIWPTIMSINIRPRLH